MTWAALFLILALILFLLAALGINAPRVQLGWLGLASLSVYFLLDTGMLPPA